MVRQILVYAVSAILVPVVRMVKGIVLLVVPMTWIGPRSGVATHAVLSAALNFGLVYALVWLCGVSRIEPVVYMLIPAVFFTMFRSWTQRSRFCTGASLEESLHKSVVKFQGGRPGSDYRELLIRREYVNEVAALVGFLLGALLLLRPK